MSPTLYVVDPKSTLYRMDPATASISAVGAVGVAQVTDIAFHGPTLYGITFSQFLNLNPNTGVATVVGNLGFSANGLAVAPNGTIYAGAGSELITIDPVTGAGTAVGGFGPGLASNGDLAIDSNGNLYASLSSGGTVQLATVNRSTGAATLIGDIGFKNVYGLEFCCCHLYGATDSGQLILISVATGKGVLVGTNGITQWGMAGRCCCC